MHSNAFYLVSKQRAISFLSFPYFVGEIDSKKARKQVIDVCTDVSKKNGRMLTKYRLARDSQSYAGGKVTK